MAPLPTVGGASACADQAGELPIKNCRIAAVEFDQPLQVRDALEVDAGTAQPDVRPVNLHCGRQHRNRDVRSSDFEVQTARWPALSMRSAGICFPKRRPGLA